jgi:hypothetical protein
MIKILSPSTFLLISSTMGIHSSHHAQVSLWSLAVSPELSARKPLHGRTYRTIDFGFQGSSLETKNGLANGRHSIHYAIPSRCHYRTATLQCYHSTLLDNYLARNAFRHQSRSESRPTSKEQGPTFQRLCCTTLLQLVAYNSQNGPLSSQ